MGVGHVGLDDLNLETGTLGGAGVKDSTAHVVNTLLQFTLNRPHVERELATLQLAFVVEDSGIDPSYLSNLQL